MKRVEDVFRYLQDNVLVIATAESCTAGRIITLLAEMEGCGAHVECGYVVYSPEAKQRLLGVTSHTLANFNLTSEQVAREMALGALGDSPANVAVATTGIVGPIGMDGLPSGTVCFAWAFQRSGKRAVFSRTHRFFGDRASMQIEASLYALEGIATHHRRVLEGEG